jgi:DNA polymerase-1
MKRLVLIDGHAIIHRAYHAFPKTLKTRKGEIVNATYGFTRMLLTVLKSLKPDYVAVALDLPKPTFRHREFVGYQAQRPKWEKEMKDQINRVRGVLKTLAIPFFEVEGFEADDVIATLARQAEEKDIETIIVTGDRDIMQLVRKRVKVYAPIKGFAQAKLFDVKEVEKLLGVTPKQIVDYKALVGDQSDNYPGVHGVGPKTAVRLLSRFGTLKQIYRNLDKIESRVANRLKEDAESAELSEKLAQIVDEVPVKLRLKDCRIHDYDQKKAIGLFEELEFKSLIEKLPGYWGEEEKEEEKDRQMKLL